MGCFVSPSVTNWRNMPFTRQRKDLKKLFIPLSIRMLRWCPFLWSGFNQFCAAWCDVNSPEALSASSQLANACSRSIAEQWFAMFLNVTLYNVGATFSKPYVSSQYSIDLWSLHYLGCKRFLMFSFV